MIEKEIEIINKLGLHARAAAKLVSTANRFSSRTQLMFGGQKADAKSIMSVMILAASQGSIITVSCEGKDQEEAMRAIEELINRYFDEGE